MARSSKTRSAERVSIGALKAHLSEYLSRARAGEEVVITDRGRPVARLAPLEGATASEGREAALVRSGQARPATGRLDPSWLRAPRPGDPTGRSLEAVLEERAEDR